MRKLPPLPRRIKGAVCDYKVTLGTQDETNSGEHVVTEAGAEIRVASTLEPNNKLQVFFHELLHKWEREGGFKLKDEDEDSDVDRLATAIYADFRRNNWKLPGEK